MSSPPQAHNFDVGTMSPAENTIKTFVELHMHIPPSASSLTLEELMTTAGVLRQASAIIEATKDALFTVRLFTPAELYVWLTRRQLTIDAYNIIRRRAAAILWQEFGGGRTER
ncbi:hypothetical protein CYLTODRAFT_253343 [Cylindrobasidium torrendii FP15055 ss-10]|uniref:Uncharacterized protein n=1 Tax=Cylindrobasidium torrendii FP15055 ss-10 TaxID=1314674 RepID=A0A0D7AT34_9AGAR|nr:hypothetical protein CYLTODRAFT_253343 [Cylindrobasidium torrendii FP15055 ss-10]